MLNFTSNTGEYAIPKENVHIESNKAKYQLRSFYRLAILTSHPIQYQAPLWHALTKHPRLDVTVYFCSDHGITEKPDPGFGVTFKWDVPLLEGYQYKFIKNYSPRPAINNTTGLLNIGIVNEILSKKPDAIFIHNYSIPIFTFAILLAHIRGILVLVRTENHLLLKISNRRQQYKKLILPRLFKIVDAFMTIGELNRRYYEYYGAPKHKIHLMPYAVNNERFFRQREEYAPMRREIRTQLGLRDETKVILYASKFLHRKHPLDLIQAFARVPLSDICLFMIGDGEQHCLCEAYVRKNEVKNVHFLGFKNQSELPKFYAIADVFVLPSENEPWGLVINEAMCFGLPVVTTNQVGAAYDLVENGKNGFIYPVGDVDALRESIQSILVDDTLRANMGRSSLLRIQDWGIKENVMAVVKVLEQIEKSRR